MINNVTNNSNNTSKPMKLYDNIKYKYAAFFNNDMESLISSTLYENIENAIEGCKIEMEKNNQIIYCEILKIEQINIRINNKNYDKKIKPNT